MTEKIRTWIRRRRAQALYRRARREGRLPLCRGCGRLIVSEADAFPRVENGVAHLACRECAGEAGVR
ncbi:hypothetical protein [Thermosulfurimonas sp. F29]|uniref:hypothetical protein n=1 Tax=Thermosulfurimonas sp. F29 TaxID=2867247 RepID=UPI001C839D98|nr:hypothetical protein [Thermosulfurimonas sp. F29]MBX6423345.1 hypothetical protein [Thermosulfurimonas sp. F29]